MPYLELKESLHPAAGAGKATALPAASVVPALAIITASMPTTRSAVRRSPHKPNPQRSEVDGVQVLGPERHRNQRGDRDGEGETIHPARSAAHTPTRVGDPDSRTPGGDGE
jgi:hypothetical protein